MHHYAPSVPDDFCLVQLSERYRRNGKSVVVTSYWAGPAPKLDRTESPLIITHGGALNYDVVVWPSAAAAQQVVESFFGPRAAGLGVKVVTVGEARSERHQADEGMTRARRRDAAGRIPGMTLEQAEAAIMPSAPAPPHPIVTDDPVGRSRRMAFAD